MADSQDPTLPEADQVYTSQRNTKEIAILTPCRFVQNALQSLEVLQAPHPTRRHHRLVHQLRHPQIRTRYLRHLQDRPRHQPPLGRTASIVHNKHSNPAHPKRMYNLELCHLSSAKEMDRNGQSQRQQERCQRLWKHGKTRCCVRYSGLR
jgi:hypothetical protein